MAKNTNRTSLNKILKLFYFKIYHYWFKLLVYVEYINRTRLNNKQIYQIITLTSVK